MPRKRSGYELVIEYFTSAEPDQAIQALHTVQAIIRGRNDVLVPKVRKAPTKRSKPLSALSTENRTEA
jgi:hypothetical protein